jgi:site-specific DNA recombinase
VADLIRFLQAHNLMIECRTTSLSLEPDHEKSAIVSSPANGPEREVRIPRQRTQQQKQKRGIVND